MSIAALHQVFDETRRLAIAGSNLAADDFRLKKLIPVLNKSGAKAPVFAKVAESVERLIKANPKESAAALLDLSSLVMAILYTQGELGGQGRIKPIKSIGIPLTKTQTPARLLKPVIDALTSGGSGRLETVREAYQQGVFQDPRLVNHAIAGLDDRYSEMADLMEKIVGDYGPSIVPLIEYAIAIKGKSGDGRRLRILHRLAPAKARPMVLDAFENGSKEMKLAAIACLGDDPADLELLMQQAGSKQRDVRVATYSRLALFDTPEVNELLVNGLHSNESWQVAAAIRETHSKARTKLVLDALKGVLAELQSWIGKSKLSAADKTKVDQLINQFDCGWACFTHRNDASLQKFAKLILDQWRDLLTLRGKNSTGTEILNSIVNWAIDQGKPSHVGLIASHHADAPEELLSLCLRAAIQSYTPEMVYEEFSPLYRQLAESKPTGKKTAKAKQEESKYQHLRETIESLGRDSLFGDWSWNDTEDGNQSGQKKSGVRLDPRWLKDFMQCGDVELLVHSVSAKDREALDYLADHLTQQVNKKSITFEDQLAAYKLSMCNYKKRCDTMITLIGGLSDERVKIKKRKGYHYFQHTHWIAKAIDLFTSDERKKVAKSLSNIDESLVDELLPHLQ
ncbi:HEAT repeat domain-containing protein [Aporhodopirellula aestuarii]|uniref:HEAT repeat domain-containing protein n=1 Tax=Aporhodopirellula aestuarii TaxID=2950107 RepID=A0ABT0U5Z3_9BACT|nr:HEAT repeat domain-containing protein [Aporhodopirellula aestuarii]MCM2372358.1 hypothetical protein [Aporhodopirellula aestuarii]